GLGSSSTFAGAIKDNRNATITTTPTNIRKVGAGTLTLSGASTYAGYTDIRNGALAVSGSLYITPITVQSGATFQLDGTLTTNTISVASGARFTVGASANLGYATISANGLMDVSAQGGFFNLLNSSLSGSGVVTGAVTLQATSINPGPIGA